MSLISGGYGTGVAGTYATTEYDAWPLIPEETFGEIAQGVSEASTALTMLQRLPDMNRRVSKMGVLGTLGNAEFVTQTQSDNLVTGADQQIDDARMLALKGTPYGTADPGFVPNEELPPLKPTHQFAWENVFIVAEPIAIILPVPEDVIADSEYDMWAAMAPRIIEAFGRAIDSAILFGQNRPVTWPTGIVPTAVSRGNVIALGTGVDVAADISSLMSVLEQQGYDPSGFASHLTYKHVLRNLRDTNNQPIYSRGLQGSPDTLWDLPIRYIKNGIASPTVGSIIGGKMDEAKYAIRQDISWKLFDQGVLSDSNGQVIANLMQQDMVAMRVVMRLGWAVPNPIHVLNQNRAGYPFAVLNA